MDSPDMVLIGRLPLPKWLPLDPEDARLTITILGACKLLNVRPGIWITGTWPHSVAISERLPSDRLQLCCLELSDYPSPLFSAPVECCRHACDAMPLVQPQQLPR